MPDERAPLESWQIGPWNRWSYQHVGEVVPTVPVPTGDAPGAWPVRPVAALDALASPPDLDGLVVLHDGVLVHERYANGMTPGTRHLSQSVAKSVLGLLAGVLVGRGDLDVDAPVADLVPEIASGGYAGATVRHLLDMTAATGFVEDYVVEFWRYDIACGWAPPREGAPARTILDYLATIPPAPDGRRHGDAFQYASPNTDLLGIVVERAGGAPLATLLARELWAPMGAEADAELAVDPVGVAVASGGLCATVRDYARIGALVLDGGRGVLPAAWVAGLGRGDAAAWGRRAWPADGDGTTGYAAQWWTLDGRTVARGIHGQLVAVDRDAGVVVAACSSWPAAENDLAFAAQRLMVSEICDTLTGRS
ncbi:serine hydrolase [Patulibacter sp. SYSU D01012]|uniref:serine hydrolase domain-containing protein n=1 Tax=Patulibacter sp. SYSU D01012 TaxID=2817381 RepID=UPI001B313756|nr:serine hydrolase [Patulibacter sp. SYSU D01012]